MDAFAYGGLDTRNAAWDVVDAARTIVGAPPVTNCVDLGTGTGATARSLRKRYQASVVGVDTSPEMLRAARDLTNTGSLDFCNDVTYKRHNAEATGLAGGKADVVSVFFLLHGVMCAADAALAKTLGPRLARIPWQVKAAAIPILYSPTVPLFSMIWIEEGFFSVIARTGWLIRLQ